MASNQEQAVKNASTPQEAVKAYDAYKQSMEASGQKPKDIRDIVR